MAGQARTVQSDSAPGRNRRRGGGDDSCDGEAKQDSCAGDVSAHPPTRISVRQPVVVGSSQSVPHLQHGADSHRILLAELFGASLTGSAIVRPHSGGISRYRGFVAGTQSDLVRSIDDTLCLVLPACLLNDQRILVNARKRHLVGVRCLQAAVTQQAQDRRPPELAISQVSAATELMFIDMFTPFSTGTDGLYEGLVNLVRSNWAELASFRGPVAVMRFMLAQVQQSMLLVSLSRRTAMPIDVEVWRQLPSTSGLVSNMHESLMALAIQVPALLCNVDAALWAGQDPSTMDTLRAQITALTDALDRWKAEWLQDVCGHDLCEPITSPAPLYTDAASSDGDCLRRTSFLDKHGMALYYICTLLLTESAQFMDEVVRTHSSPRREDNRPRETMKRLCELGARLIEEEDGLLSKALSAFAPLHFARQWCERNDDQHGLALIERLESRARQQVPFLSWASLLPLSLVSFYMTA